MSNNKGNVSAGKPKITGAIHVAPTGTALPTDATTALNEAFKCVGYIDQNGLKNNNTPNTEAVRAWGGDVVLELFNSADDKFKFGMIEVTNKDVLSLVYGSGNVKGDLSTGLTITANNNPKDAVSVVVEMVLNSKILKRIVIPAAYVTAVDEISYVDNGAITYGTELTCLADDAGNTHYEYLKESE